MLALVIVTCDKYLSEKATAKRLGVKVGTLANWRWRGYGPAFFKVGRRVEYLQHDVDDWKRRQRRTRPSRELTA